MCCQENQLPSLLWNLCVFLEKEGRGVCVRAHIRRQECGPEGVCVHVTAGRACRGALVFGVSRGGLDLLPFISFHIPESAGAAFPNPSACCPGRRPPPLFLIPVSRGVRSLQATSVWGDGGSKRPVLLQGWGRPPPPNARQLLLGNAIRLWHSWRLPERSH